MYRRAKEFLAENRCLALLVSLVLVLVLGPTLDETPYSWIVTLFHSLIGFAALLALTYRRSAFVIGFIIGTPYFLGLWAHAITGEKALDWIHVASGMALYLYVLLALLGHILRGPQVTRDDIFGAVGAYMLLGLAWCLLYVVLESVHPGSFEVDDPSAMTMIYFSFTTLTTLGYGDITPVTDIAKSLAIVEAMTGLMFVAVLIGRLVAVYRADRSGG